MSPISTTASSASVAAAATAHATAATACRRCYTRKKKCDRSLPNCTACTRARSECIYDNGNPETARLHALITNLTEQNRSLRDKVALLEVRLAQATSARAQFSSPGQDPANGCVLTPLPTPALSSAALAPSSNGGTPSGSSASPQQGTLVPAGAGVPGGEKRIGDENYAHTIAERIVRRIFITPLHVGACGSLRAKIHQHLGTEPEDDVEDALCGGLEALSASGTSTCALWPSKALAKQLIALYFDNINVQYPLFCRDVIDRDLEDVYGAVHPAEGGMHFHRCTEGGPDLRVFTLFLMFAIGCGILETRSNRQRTDTGLLAAFALQHISALLRSDPLTCIAGIMLYAIYTFSDFARMNPNAVITIAADLAIEYGLHRDDPSHSEEERNERRQVFWSIFCVDRCLAFTMNRPNTIPDDIIQTQLPVHLHAGGRSRLLDCITATELFHQVVIVRRLQGMVNTEVYLKGRHQKDPEEVLLRLRNHIDRWYNSVPEFSSGRKHAYLETMYHLIIQSLYRPSPMVSSTAPARLPILRRSCARLCSLYAEAQRECRQIENYVTFLHVTCTALALVYALLEGEGDMSNLRLRSWRETALEEVATAEHVLGSFCANWPGIGRFTTAFADFAARFRAKLAEHEEAPPSPTPVWLVPDLVPSIGSTASAGDTAANGDPAADAIAHAFSQSPEIDPLAPNAPKRSDSLSADSAASGPDTRVFADFGAGSAFGGGILDGIGLMQPDMSMADDSSADTRGGTGPGTGGGGGAGGFGGAGFAFVPSTSNAATLQGGASGFPDLCDEWTNGFLDFAGRVGGGAPYSNNLGALGGATGAGMGALLEPTFQLDVPGIDDLLSSVGLMGGE